ncbi:transmembrane protein 232 [Mixophyes fleayi]|uniref:transmembrane protein 232 n=1 Tax=Mixophyes fleayi TaxID=3061075 RepID=UPI003F4DB124
MPIVKVPVIQKFGIISTKHHRELQQKLLEKTKETLEEKSTGHRRPLEVTEEFIKQFNDAEVLEDQERMLDAARKILLRCKRRSGIETKGSGNHVNLHLAWTELILMAQCKGKVQEDALDMLLISMDQAEFQQDHIPLLFYIAESVLYRICCDAPQKLYLLSCEVKLSKLGFLAFLRLYTFHLIGQLQHFEEQKKRLSTYIKALPECEATYKPFPTVLSSVHVMLKVGEIICDLEYCMETKTILQKQPVSTDKLSLNSGAAEIDPFLWHCLLLWQHIQNNSTNYHDIIKHLLLLKEHLHQENWLDSLLALFILGEAAKIEISCLRILLELGCNLMSNLQEQAWQVISVYTSVLADICMHGTTSDIKKHAYIGFQSESTLNDGSNKGSLNGLLHFNPPNTSESKDQLNRIVSYCTVYNLVKLCYELQWDLSRDGLRNAIWKALDQRKIVERDSQVIDAMKIAEAELNGPSNPFISLRAMSPSASGNLAFFQHVGCRLANALAQQFLPPVVPYIPTTRKPFQRQIPRKPADVIEHSMEKKAAHLSLRKEQLCEEPSLPLPVHFITRTNMALEKVIEDQWAKEMTIRMKEAKEEMVTEQQEKQKKEEEHFTEIMKKRQQKLKKTSKPYELLT